MRETILFFLAGYSTFMEKEIFEQPESIINTMRGRVDFENYKGIFLCTFSFHVFLNFSPKFFLIFLPSWVTVLCYKVGWYSCLLSVFLFSSYFGWFGESCGHYQTMSSLASHCLWHQLPQCSCGNNLFSRFSICNFIGTTISQWFIVLRQWFIVLRKWFIVLRQCFLF